LLDCLREKPRLADSEWYLARGAAMSINRRKALLMGLGTYLTALAPCASAQDMSGTKVIVIGAGLSGLAAAQRLRAQGAEVVVLEAGPSIGGRIRTDWSLGAPFEYGAGWIHGPSRRNPVKQIADTLGAPTFVTDDDNLDVFAPDGDALTDDQYARLDALYDVLVDDLYYPTRPGALSVQEMLQRDAPDILNDPLGRWMLSAYFEFSIGAGIEDMSAAHAFETEAFDGADVILPGGYDALLAPLSDGLDIRLNSPVSGVRYDETGVSVDGERADYVICTVPLGVLKAGQIAFDPPLPDALQGAIDQVGFGTVTKIALKFADPFWDVETQYFGIMTTPKGRWNYWMNYRTFSDENILLGVSVGQYASVADRMSVPEMTADAVEVLRSVWGEDVTVPQAVLTTRWSEDPHFHGAYSYAQAGGSLSQFTEFERPLSGRLFFAGEHTFFDHLGTTHGALMSGRRAADAILAAR
jgi:monoamine oxidase